MEGMEFLGRRSFQIFAGQGIPKSMRNLSETPFVRTQDRCRTYRMRPLSLVLDTFGAQL